MSARSVLILAKASGTGQIISTTGIARGNAWGDLLTDYFSDMSAPVTVTEDPAKAPALFDRSLPAVLFTEPCFLSRSLVQKIKVRKSTDPVFRCCLLGDAAVAGTQGIFDAFFPEALSRADLEKRFLAILPMPAVLRILVVDDEAEIRAAVRDHFEGRKGPEFAVSCASNGKEALEALARERPDVIILDIKMPVMDGREFYAELRRKKIEVPVIVFFDSVSGEELSEMRRFGDPAVVEKGGLSGSLGAMTALVKKLVFFSK